MKQILLLAFILFTMFKVNAQSQCGTDEYDAYLKRTNPSYAAERQEMEQQIYSILKNKQNNPNARISANDCQQPSGVFTIPVVVHVIHKGEAIGTGTNISDAQIQGAIQGMNERWRKVIGDGVDMEIQFALAVRDTNNNATNGITRHNGSVFPRYVSNGIYIINDTIGANKDTLRWNTDWDYNKYINIFIVDLKDAAGFAYYGGYIFIGYNSSIANTLTHEMGHFFFLQHTFEGDYFGFQCPVNINCLSDGDGVCDTPPHKRSECSTTGCTASGDLQNSFKNYMSYCGTRTRFTQGQKDIVRYILSVRQDLITSNGLIPATTPLDVGIDRIFFYEQEYTQSYISMNSLCDGWVTPKFILNNYGNQTITSVEGNIIIDGVSQNFVSNRPIISNDSIWVTLQQMQLQNMKFNTQTTHIYEVNITKINGQSNDYTTVNNHYCRVIYAKNFNVKVIPKVLPADAGILSVDTILVNCQRTYQVSVSPKSNYKFFGWYESGVDLGDGFYFGDIPLTFDTTLNMYIGDGGNSCWGRYPTAVLYQMDTLIVNSNIPQGIIKGYATFSYGTGTDTLCINDTIITDTTFIIKGNNYILRNTLIRLEAISDSCYQFNRWESNNGILSGNPIYETQATNINLSAIFYRRYYNIALISNPSNGGTVNGAGNFACDSAVTVKATAKTGYQFINWTEGSTIVSTDSNYTFLVSSTRNLKANFSLLTGIKQTTINEISNVYPNPVNDILQVEIHSKQSTSITLNIVDMKGSLIATKALTNSKGKINTSFDVSKLPKGNYILNLYDEEGMASYKFVVQ